MKKETYQVFIDGVSTIIPLKDFNKYNVLVNKCSGLNSHSAIEKHSFEKHWYSMKCPFFGIMQSFRPTHLTVKPIDSFVLGTSTVSFS